jgi:hypothetical protein
MGDAGFVQLISDEAFRRGLFRLEEDIRDGLIVGASVLSGVGVKVSGQVRGLSAETAEQECICAHWAPLSVDANPGPQRH